MADEELLLALRRIAVPDEHRCLGCGYERACGIHGCAVINAAAERIWALLAEAHGLRRLPNDPLTLEELREMDGEPVWVVSGEFKSWKILDVIDVGEHKDLVCFTDWSTEPIKPYGRDWIAYRRRPEEGTE